MMTITPRDGADLRWYFSGESDAALGACSAHGALVDAALGGRGGGGSAGAWGAISRAHGFMPDVVRERRLRGLVSKLTTRQSRTLELVYGSCRPFYGNEETQHYFGRVLAIVHMTPTAAASYPGAPGDSFTSWLAKLLDASKHSPATGALLRALRTEAESAIVDAEVAYRAARGGPNFELSSTPAKASFQDFLDIFREAA